MQKATSDINILHFFSRLCLQFLHSMLSLYFLQRHNHTSITSRFNLRETFSIQSSDFLIFHIHCVR